MHELGWLISNWILMSCQHTQSPQDKRAWWVCVLSVELFNVFQLLCHRPILKWARENGHESYPDFQTAKMEDTKFLDLNVQLGVPYLYQHQGNCEHIIIFTDIRSVKISWHPGLLVMVMLQFVAMMPNRTANVLVAMRR